MTIQNKHCIIIVVRIQKRGDRVFKNLIIKRKEKNITQEKMAEIIGKKASTYAKKERGELPITIDEAKKICEFLDCELNIFLN